MRMELSIRNQQGLVANFYATEADIVEAMQQAAARAAGLCQQVVQLICAVDTGFMRDHVRVVSSQNKLAWEVGWDASDFFNAGLAFYPWFVEFGTRYMAAQPALGPAYDYVVPIYQQDVADLVSIAIARRRAA